MFAEYSRYGGYREQRQVGKGRVCREKGRRASLGLGFGPLVKLCRLDYVGDICFVLLSASASASRLRPRPRARSYLSTA